MVGLVVGTAAAIVWLAPTSSSVSFHVMGSAWLGGMSLAGSYWLQTRFRLGLHQHSATIGWGASSVARQVSRAQRLGYAGVAGALIAVVVTVAAAWFARPASVAVAIGAGVAAGLLTWCALQFRAVRDFGSIEAQQLAHLAERNAVERAALEQRQRLEQAYSDAQAVVQVGSSYGLSAFTPLPHGSTLLRDDESVHLSIYAGYQRLVDGGWTQGQTCQILVTTARILVRTHTHGELSFWWDGLTALVPRDQAAEFHYESGAPLLLVGHQVASVIAYASLVRNL